MGRSTSRSAADESLGSTKDAGCPHRAEVRAVLDRVGFRNIALDEATGRCILRGPAWNWTRVGSGKGYAVDRIDRGFLKQYGYGRRWFRPRGSSIYGLGGRRARRAESADPRSQGPRARAWRSLFEKTNRCRRRAIREVFPVLRQDLQPHYGPQNGWPRKACSPYRWWLRARSTARPGPKPLFVNGRAWAAKTQTSGPHALLLRKNLRRIMRVAPMNSRFLDACRRRPPRAAGLVMRQAGTLSAAIPRAAVAPQHSRNRQAPDLAAAATLQPVEFWMSMRPSFLADLLLPVEPWD